MLRMWALCALVHAGIANWVSARAMRIAHVMSRQNGTTHILSRPSAFLRYYDSHIIIIIANVHCCCKSSSICTKGHVLALLQTNKQHEEMDGIWRGDFLMRSLIRTWRPITSVYPPPHIQTTPDSNAEQITCFVSRCWRARSLVFNVTMYVTLRYMYVVEILLYVRVTAITYN